MIPCPSCHSQINGKLPKPGKYTPKCPKCGATFQMVVPEDPEMTVQVKVLPAKPKPEVTQHQEATGDFTENLGQGQTQEVTGAYHPPRHEPERTVEVTGAYHGQDEATEATGAYIPKNRATNNDRTAAISDASARSNIDATTDIGAAPEAKKPTKKGKIEAQEMPDHLGGYELMKQLGAGGMGAVYLARQTSLDRSVAVKVMHANWARDPIFLARFTREAYAAAQLNHHNVVQIYDIGADAGINFFSMEFVEGKSLGDVLKRNGTIEPNVAVGYILQAARGLKFAHDRGMVHRDIKPDNLMLNVEGIVKVADLGLVKTRGMMASDDALPDGSPGAKTHVGGSKLQSVSVGVTNVGSAMGSPSYMSPEQCRDAAGVDHRADIYSLGCTLYAMLSGHAPFLGKTAMDVIHKHLNDPPPPLLSVAKSTPKDLAAIVDRTLVKDPEQRFQSMEEFIGVLRNWQDQSKAGQPRPTDEQITVFEGLTKQIVNNPMAKLGGTLAVIVPLAGAVLGLGVLFVKPAIGVGLLLASVTVVVAGLIASGLLTDSYLFRKIREWVFGARIVDWLTIGLAGVLFAVGLYFSGYVVAGLVGIVLGTLLGAGFAFGIARPAYQKRLANKADCDNILKRMRLAGVDEDAVRQFVVTASGDHWEAVYETIFGYAAKLPVRAAMLEKGETKPKQAAWRDGIINRIESSIEARKQAKAKKHLLKLEQKRFEAEGVSVAEAKAKAADAADAIVEHAVEIRAANHDQSKKINVRTMMKRYELAKMEELKRPRKAAPMVLVSKFFRTVFDPRLRLVLGALCIVGGLMWVKQNPGATAIVEAVGNTVGAVENTKQAGALLEAASQANLGARPLQVSFLPPIITNLFDSFNPIVAGVILIMSTFAGNGMAILIMTLGALIALTGHKLSLPIPTINPLTPGHLTMAVGMGVAVVTLIVFRRR